MQKNIQNQRKSHRDYIFKISASIMEWAKDYQILFIMYLIVGVAVFFMLISQNLVNSMDGLWHNSSYYADTWERSIGRWFWPYLDKFRFGIVSAPVNSFVTLIMISCGNILLMDLFQVKHRLPAFLAGSLFIATPLVCDSLSYCYMSVTFGLAYLLSILSAYCALKIPHHIGAVIIGSILLACSMGNYQAYFGVTCVILIFFFIKMLFQNEEGNAVLNMALKAICTVLIGGILYEVMVTITCWIYNVSLASYKDADSISLKSIIVNLPQRIPEAYKEFFEFFFTNTTQKLIFHLKDIYIIVFIMVACILVCKLVNIFKRNILYGFLSLIAILLIPLACNAILLLITSSNYLLMTGGVTLLFPLCIYLFDDYMNGKLFYSFFLICLTGVLWINVCIVNNDQLAMREGRMSVVTIAENIITQLANEGYMESNSDTTFAIVGRPSENVMFAKTAAWKNANTYAKFGGDYWSISHGDHGNNRRSWSGLLLGYCGINLNFCSDNTYAELISTSTVENMPCFPEDGSICEVDGVVVIKVSDNY